MDSCGSPHRRSALEHAVADELQDPAAGIDHAELLHGIGRLEQEAVAEVPEAEQDRRVQAAGDGIQQEEVSGVCAVSGNLRVNGLAPQKQALGRSSVSPTASMTHSRW